MVDLTLMMLNGYTLNDVIRPVEFETAKGAVSAYIFQIPTLTALGRTLTNVEVSSYDFIGNDVLFDVDGVLGLDFFKETELTINFKTYTLSLT